mmetsp:Transcript_6851/g.12224  ORF Transcript_6851/g.12224 Transcript_6851/m.12224 type:complete len:314 (+) Transcript_6851:1921-2862(+)
MDYRLNSGDRIPQYETIDVQILPNDKMFHCAQLQGLQRVLDHETILARILANFIHILLKQFLLLDQLNLLQRIGTVLNGLAEPILPPVRYVHHLDHNLGKSFIEQITPHQFRLKVGRTRQHQPLNIGPLTVGNKQLRGHLGHFSDVIMPLFQTQTGETQCGLSTPPMLLGKIDREFVQYLPPGALDGTVETSVTVHNDESEGLVVHEEFVEVLGVELVVTEVEGCVDAFEGFEVDVDFLLLPIVGHDRAAVHDESVLGAFVVQFEPLLCAGDSAEDTETVHSTFNVRCRAVFIGEHFINLTYLCSWLDDERDH